MSAVFTLRSPDVVHETIDGETVVINMAEGSYYRLDGASAEAWQRLAAGASAADLCRHLSARYDAAPAELEAAVAAFLASLCEYQLVVGGETAPAPDSAPAPVGSRSPFPGLAIQRFTELQELLYVDPVHEVDETGWPSRSVKT